MFFLSLEFLENIFIDRMHWQVFQKQITLNGYVKDFEAEIEVKYGRKVKLQITEAESEDDFYVRAHPYHTLGHHNQQAQTVLALTSIANTN